VMPASRLTGSIRAGSGTIRGRSTHPMPLAASRVSSTACAACGLSTNSVTTPAAS
jgi:hypothetical protein